MEITEIAWGTGEYRI